MYKSIIALLLSLQLLSCSTIEHESNTKTKTVNLLVGQIWAYNIEAIKKKHPNCGFKRVKNYFYITNDSKSCVYAAMLYTNLIDAGRVLINYTGKNKISNTTVKYFSDKELIDFLFENQGNNIFGYILFNDNPSSETIRMLLKSDTSTYFKDELCSKANKTLRDRNYIEKQCLWLNNEFLKMKEFSEIK